MKQSPDAFSRESLPHLRDVDVERFERRILGEDNPSLPDIDGARVAREVKWRTSAVN